MTGKHIARPKGHNYEFLKEFEDIIQINTAYWNKLGKNDRQAAGKQVRTFMDTVWIYSTYESFILSEPCQGSHITLMSNSLLFASLWTKPLNIVYIIWSNGSLSMLLSVSELSISRFFAYRLWGYGRGWISVLWLYVANKYAFLLFKLHSVSGRYAFLNVSVH